MNIMKKNILATVFSFFVFLTSMSVPTDANSARRVNCADWYHPCDHGAPGCFVIIKCINCREVDADETVHNAKCRK